MSKQFFYTYSELRKLGFNKIGKNVKISNSCKFYSFEGEIGNNARVDDYSIFKGQIHIGDNVHISSFCYFAAVGGRISIGELTGISNKVSIYAVTDDFIGDYLTNPTVNEKFKNVTRGKVIIGKNVSIGSHCLILPNIKIGNSCSLGAMSLVNKSLKNGQILYTKQEKKYGIKKNLKKINIKINQFKKSLNSTV
jgi:acetyltransferase-like isoleucine patch superfamily enzyme